MAAPTANIQVNNVIKDEDGRFIYLNIDFNDVTYNLVNIYGPNKDNEKN
jgi:hypothetical protein